MTDLEKNKSVISLLRHGETTAGKCFLGTTDASLSNLGWQQMRSAKLTHDYDLVISSPLLRCYEFAELYAGEINRPLHAKAEFREIDFGEWEAKTTEELWQTDQQALSNFWSDSEKYKPPAGEALRDFQRRVINGYTDLQKQAKGKRVLVICHAGVIKILLCYVLGIELKNMHAFAINHAGVSQISLWQDAEVTHQVEFINRY